MGLATQLQADVENVFLNTAEFAETVTYTPSGGSPKSVPVVFVPEPDEHEEQVEGTQRIRKAMVYVPTDATLGIASPSPKDNLTRNSEAWAAVSILSNDHGIAILGFVRSEPVRKHQQGTLLQRE